jgi:vacuolar-type H+-ATPase subunit F/Vma7
MTMRIIGSREVVAAFALAGVPGTAAGPGEVLAALDAVRSQPEVRIVVIEEETADYARAEIDNMKLDPKAPLVVEIPGFIGPMEGRRTPLDLVRQALGIPM